MVHSLSSNVSAPIGYLCDMPGVALGGTTLLVGQIVQSGVEYRKRCVTLLEDRYYSG